jgi:hypothetical protein
MTSFKVTPWHNANKLPLKYAIGTPLEFMLDEPDIEQCYLKGTELLTMSITIRQIGYDYSSDKKTNLQNYWFERFCRGARKYGRFFQELYKAGEPGSHVYFFKVTLPNASLFSLLLANKAIPYKQEDMMQYLESTRFAEVGFKMSMNEDVGGSLEVEDYKVDFAKKRKLDNDIYMY